MAEQESDEEESINWIMLSDGNIMIEVSMFLEIKGINSDKTSKRYGEVLLTYFRFLNTRNKDYMSATKRDIYDYVLYRIYYDKDEVRHIDSQRRLNTLRQEVSIVGVFYDWLVDIHRETGMTSPVPKSSKKSKNNKNNYSFLYGQLWQSVEEARVDILGKAKDKPVSKHKKWYSEEEIEILANSFKKRRDRVIYLISVRLGCRIEEILSIQEEDYNSFEQSLFIRKSKTNERYLDVPRELCDEIDVYIYTERRDVEAELGLLKYLFVNLRKDRFYGKKVSTRGYLSILKTYSQRVGFDPTEIITHAGRSTRAQELLEMQIEGNSVSDPLIMEIMGWNNISSIKPYKKQNNLKLQKKVNDMIADKKRNPNK